jgi:hypothetical protein
MSSSCLFVSLVLGLLCDYPRVPRLVHLRIWRLGVQVPPGAPIDQSIGCTLPVSMLLPWLWLRFRSRFGSLANRLSQFTPSLRYSGARWAWRNVVSMSWCPMISLMRQIDPSSQARHSKALASTQRDARAYKFGTPEDNERLSF